MAYSILASQIGYRPGDRKTAFVRGDERGGDVGGPSDAFDLVDAENEAIVYAGGNIRYWGEKWGSHYWAIDFSDFAAEGSFYIRLADSGSRSTPFLIRESLFREQTLMKVAVEQLQARIGGKMGWQDCGSDLRAVEGNATQLLGLIDSYESFHNLVGDEDKLALMRQIRHGADYLACCQREDGSYNNEYYLAPDITNWHMGMIANIGLARANELTSDVGYLNAAKKGWHWCLEHSEFSMEWRTTEIEETRKIYGKYHPWLPPKELRARDKLLIVWAGTVLYADTNDIAYKNAAMQYAADLCDNLQFLDYAEFDHGIFGNFYAWGSEPTHQKSWEHCGWGYNCAAILPDEITGIVNLLEMFPYEKDWMKWRYLLKQYAYGFLKPTASLSPFGIYPLGLFDGEIRFFGPSWHGFIGMYAYAAKNAMQVARVFDDPELENIAIRNMQWIMGLNVGEPKEAAVYEGISWLTGAGHNFFQSWTTIPGSIANGYCANPQFKLGHLDDLDDEPKFMSNEDWIVYTGAWLTGLSQVERGFVLKIKTLYKGKPVKAEVNVQLPDNGWFETNAKGYARIETLPVQRHGTVIIVYDGMKIERSLTTVSGKQKTIVVDFSDCLIAELNVDAGEKTCLLQVTNAGRDVTRLSAELKSIGVTLSQERMESELGAGETKIFRIQYEPVASNRIRPFAVYAEIYSLYSYEVCEKDWRVPVPAKGDSIHSNER